MNIGRLKYAVLFEQKTIVRDDYGSEQEAWTSFLNIKADVEYQGGTKSENGNELFSSQQLKIKVRYYEGTTETMRVTLMNKHYRIVFINPLVFRKVLQLTIELMNE